MLATHKITKLQKDKRQRRPVSAGSRSGSRPTSGKKRPQSAGPKYNLEFIPESTETDTYDTESEVFRRDDAVQKFSGTLDDSSDSEDQTFTSQSQNSTTGPQTTNLGPNITSQTQSSGASTEVSPEVTVRTISNGRPRTAKRTGQRPKSAGKKTTGTTSSQRKETNSGQNRPARRMEAKYARRVYKAEVKQAQKPNLEGSLTTKLKNLWVVFIMSFFPKIFTAVGLVIFLLGMIILGIGTNAESNYSEGEAIGATLFVLGLISLVLGLVGLKMRRTEKKKMRAIASKQAKQKYAVHNDASNGGVSTITGNTVPVENMYGRHKTSFTALETPESGFTNLAAVVDDYHLPGSPYRKKRRESIEAQVNHFQAGSPRPGENPDVLVFPVPTSGLNPFKNKSHGGKNVKKSKGKKEASNLTPKLDEIPEIIITDPSPRNSIAVEQGMRSETSSPVPSNNISTASSPVLTHDNSPKPSPIPDNKSEINKPDSNPTQKDVQKHSDNDSWDDSDDDDEFNVEKESV